MIHHVSISARDPRHVADVLAELMRGRAYPFPGGVADSFIQYGYLTPLFWIGFGWFVGRIYARAKLGNDPRWVWAYAGIVCVTHWLISQSIAAAYVPGIIFVLVPWVASAVFRKHQPPSGSGFSTGRS